MLKSSLVTLSDLKEQATLQRRQRYEDERKKRIFNAKQRLYGLDYEALQKQIYEKKVKEQADEEVEKKFIAEADRRREIVHAKEKELAQERTKYQNEINYFRCKFQRKEESREFDINDPNLLKKSKPPRHSDTDTKLGISSAQIFVGEDLDVGERKKAQREQQRSWLEQQMREKKKADEDRAKANSLLQKAMEARDQLTLEQATLSRRNAMKMQYAVLDYNKKLAYEQSERKKMQKKHEAEDNLAEIYNMMTSDMLTENPDVANCPNSLNKKIAYLYRGMTPAEMEHFKREQFRQIEENKKKKTEEQLTEKMFEQQDINLTRSCIVMNKDRARKMRSAVADLKEENQKLAKEQTARKIYLDKNVYTNRISNEFYDQFNRTSR